MFGVEGIVMVLLFSMSEDPTIIRSWCWEWWMPVRFRFAFVGGFEEVFRRLKSGLSAFGVGWAG